MADRLRRSQLQRLLTRQLIAAALVAIALASVSGDQSAAAGAPLPLLVGQTIIVRMPGRTPTPAFLERIRRGEIGGIVLYQENYGPAGPLALVHTLQDAARAGRNPPLLIAIDQEGGIVKRLPGAPSLSPPEMATPIIAQAQGLATARNLAASGINVDLAPVLDIGRGGFITPRTFGSTAAAVSARGVAFARGLLMGRVLPTAKHFPGLGYAPVTTDTASVVVHATKQELTADLAPFRAAITAGIPIVLASTAIYPSLGSRLPAACSTIIMQRLLRDGLDFRGVVITDALDTAAVTNELSVPAAALKALQSGVDMVLVAGTTSQDANKVSETAYTQLLTAAKTGALPIKTLERSYRRIIALKKRLVST